MYVIWELHL